MRRQAVEIGGFGRLNQVWESFQLWIEGRQEVVAWAVGLSVLTFVGSIIAVPVVVIQMRADYFTRQPDTILPVSPLRLLRHLLKNVIGYLLLLCGILMLVLPGQGLLTIALGISLIDFPGKRKLQLRIVRLKGVSRPIAWIRRKAEKEPLIIPENRAENPPDGRGV